MITAFYVIISKDKTKSYFLARDGTGLSGFVDHRTNDLLESSLSRNLLYEHESIIVQVRLQKQNERVVLELRNLRYDHSGQH